MCSIAHDGLRREEIDADGKMQQIRERMKTKKNNWHKLVDRKFINLIIGVGLKHFNVYWFFYRLKWNMLIITKKSKERTDWNNIDACNACHRENKVWSVCVNQYYLNKGKCCIITIPFLPCIPYTLFLLSQPELYGIAKHACFMKSVLLWHIVTLHTSRQYSTS